MTRQITREEQIRRLEGRLDSLIRDWFKEQDAGRGSQLESWIRETKQEIDQLQGA